MKSAVAIIGAAASFADKLRSKGCLRRDSGSLPTPGVGDAGEFTWKDSTKDEGQWSGASTAPLQPIQTLFSFFDDRCPCIVCISRCHIRVVPEFNEQIFELSDRVTGPELIS